MLESVYVDTVEERAIVALKPKPAFRALFQIATTRQGSGVVLYKENPPVKGDRMLGQWGGAKVYHQRGHWPA